MDSYIEVSFNPVSKEQSEILIANLADAGYEGFEEKEKELKAFIKKGNYDVDLIRQLSSVVQTNFAEKEIENKNWNKEWESNFHPVVVDDYVAVRADFHEPIPNVQYEIVITPKMSFGTGHHATTFMMMQQMQEIDFTNKSVFDFGTGTGILAILASKSGAARVLAIDIDEWSIENAAENFQKNNVVTIDLELSGIVPADRVFDIILANITKNIIMENFSLLYQQLNKNGILLVSGLLKGDEHEILLEAQKHSLILHKVQQQGDWLCLRFLR